MYLGIHKHPREKINPTSTYLSNFLGCYMIFPCLCFTLSRGLLQSLSVGRYVATDPQSSRSLCSDRPSHSFGRYVATDPSRTQSLRSDRTVSDIDQRVRPKSVHSRLFLNASSHVSQSYYFSFPSIGVII